MDLFPESQGIISHGIDNSKGFQTNTHIADFLSTVLETFFDDDSGSLQSSTGFLDNVNQSQKGTSVGKEIINKKYVIFRSKEFFG